jgi:hypothetical protein
MNDLITLLDYLKQNPGARLSFSYDDWPGVPIAKYRASIELPDGGGASTAIGSWELAALDLRLAMEARTRDHSGCCVVGGCP